MEKGSIPQEGNKILLIIFFVLEGMSEYRRFSKCSSSRTGFDLYHLQPESPIPPHLGAVEDGGSH